MVKLIDNKKKTRNYKNRRRYSKTMKRSIRGGIRRYVTTRQLGEPPGAYSSGRNVFVDDHALQEFVDTIEEGPQVVSLIVPPQRHAFLIDPQPDYHRLMVSDWNSKDGVLPHNYGKEKINGKKNPEYAERFSQYSKFLELVCEKYKGRCKPLTIDYYPVDDDLYCMAEEQNEAGNDGGWANYVYAWYDKHTEIYPTQSRKRKKSSRG